MIPRVDLDAPIEEGRALGGIFLGEPIEKYGQLLFEAWRLQGASSVQAVSPMEIRYHLPGVNVGVDAFSGVIFKLTAVSSYRGAFNGISIGMPAENARQLLQGLYFDEIHSLFRLAGRDGVCLEVALDDPLESQAWDSKIEFITVIDVDLYHKMRKRQWQ